MDINTLLLIFWISVWMGIAFVLAWLDDDDGLLIVVVLGWTWPFWLVMSVLMLPFLFVNWLGKKVRGEI